jgi:acetamidase/formamidase
VAGEIVWDFSTVYNLAGPVAVEGAEPGDTLEVEILALEPGEWGWTAMIPELGLLPDDFPQPYLKVWDLREGQSARLGERVRVPIDPFLGTMGVVTDEPGSHSPFPPHRGGGNLDNRHLRVGATLWVPVWVEGGLFSCGDAHAAQGDGEVCVTGIECPLRATLRLTVRKRALAVPSFRTPTPPPSTAGAYFGTMGLGPDLMEAAREAVRAMIGWLGEEHGLSREDAYVLCSVAGDLKIHEIVDAGVWNVGMTMPLAVLD